jgi:PTH2 family peptidyl-tRNA hydrolase
MERKQQEMKQVIVLRTDLGMSTGKLVAQACHASVEAAFSAPTSAIEQWRSEGQSKIVLRVNSVSELTELKNRCEASSLVHALIADAGRTELAQGTITALAIGPTDDKSVDRLVGAVPLF